MRISFLATNKLKSNSFLSVYCLNKFHTNILHYNCAGRDCTNSLHNFKLCRSCLQFYRQASQATRVLGVLGSPCALKLYIWQAKPYIFVVKNNQCPDTKTSAFRLIKKHRKSLFEQLLYRLFFICM